jgi:hypothetical protein
MTDTKNVTVQVGPGLPGTLFLVFLVLKLTDTIDWSWWWVTSPLWLGFAILAGLAVIFGAGAGIFYGLAWVFDYKNRKRRKKRRQELLANRKASRAIRSYGKNF